MIFQLQMPWITTVQLKKYMIV